jgi:thioredoxin 1
MWLNNASEDLTGGPKMAQSKNVREATDATFTNDVVNSSSLSLVDFWAEWCGPCRMLGPTIDEIADEFSGQLNVFKMNVDQNPETPTQYRIKGIPTVLFFQGGELVDQLVGNQPKDAIIEVVKKHLGRTPA